MELQTYDFIIVGGGAAGSALTSRLANTPKAPRILLLEAGGPNTAPELLEDEYRYTAFHTFPHLNYSYRSLPLSHLSTSRTIDCSRGKGLGGSTAIKFELRLLETIPPPSSSKNVQNRAANSGNLPDFGAWLLGDANDYNHWAELVGDDCWKWDGENGVKERFRKVENLHLDGVEESIIGKAGFLDIKSLEGHSKKGMVDLTYTENWHSTQVLTLKAAREFGMPMNTDINSGNGQGMGTGAATVYNGTRVTASTSYLRDSPLNLIIKTNSPVAKVLFDSYSGDEIPKAIGVQTVSGEKFYASKEVVICGGSLDSPKVLLLSGIGPPEDLSALNIPVIHPSLYVGANLQDHNPVLVSLLLKGTKDSDIPIYNSSPMGFLSSPAVKFSPEFHALPPQTRSHLEKVASYELITTHRTSLIPPHIKVELSEDARVMLFHTVLMNEQSRGTITLSSSNPLSSPLINTRTLSHPYDRRLAIESLRETLAFIKTPLIAAETQKVLVAPKDESDEGLWEFWKQGVSGTWHFTGTCKMGREGDAEAVVDREFRVRGVGKLRVCDMSVAPIVPNNHVQSTTYLIGETLAEKMIKEYGFA